MEDDTAHQLHAERTLSEDTVVCLADNRKGIGKNVIKRFTVGKAGAEFRGLGGQFFIGEGAKAFLQRLNLVHNGGDFLQFLLRVGTEQFVKQTHIKKHPFTMVGNTEWCLKISTKILI